LFSILQPKMKTSYKTFLRSNKPKTDGSIPVYLRIIINRKFKDYALGLSVFEPEKYWNAEKQRVKRNTWGNMHYINGTIEDQENKAGDIFRQMKMANIPLTIAEFERRFLNPIEKKDSFYAYAEHELELLRQKNASPETIRSYKSYISKMKRFKPTLTFAEISKDLITDYRAEMIAQGNQMNTYHKALSWMRTIVKRAINDGLIQDNPFQHIRLQRKTGHREALTILELARIERIYDEEIIKGYVANIAKCFLFAVYTGLRYSDVRQLTFDDIKTVTSKGKDQSFINLMMHKTKDHVSIPLIDKAIALVQTEGFKAQKVLRVPTNQVVNRYLKGIGELAGLNKQLTFHVARHTFATISITLGIPIEVIQKLLGHTSLKNTLIYAKVLDEVKSVQMGKWDSL